MNRNTIEIPRSPSARVSRCKRASSPHHACQISSGPRARVWLEKNAGMLLVGIGEALAFVPIAANAVNPCAGTGAEWFVCSAMLIGSGIGWIIRDERDGDGCN